MIVVLVMLVLPVLLDRWEGCAAVSARVAVWHWLRCPLLAVEDAGVAIVEVHVGECGPIRPLAQAVASVSGDVGEDVGANIPATKRVEVPVSLDCGDLGVVVVEVIVGGSDKVVWNGVTDEDAEYSVLDGLCLIFIESDQHQSVVHESLVGKKGSKEVLKPYTSNGD